MRVVQHSTELASVARPSWPQPVLYIHALTAFTYSTYLGQAEVGDADVALVVEQHVLRLEVAVDHLAGVVGSIGGK